VKAAGGAGPDGLDPAREVDGDHLLTCSEAPWTA